jgi:hypothetical protein
MTEREAYGFLQLCADRRYHRMTMDAFEAGTGLASDRYWIEVTAGGAPSFDAVTATAAYAYEMGARIMGWGAHGDGCGGFPGRSDDEMKAMLEAVARERAEDFPDAEHWMLFASGGRAEAGKVSEGWAMLGGGG